ncbi:MAG: c-type cytochrome, partial [Myxococcales bacterium]|nr:c-type cytochrome [Myxococcales bacterium]
DRGEALFADVGCDACHVPNMTTEDGVDVPLFSDLLLHDVAPDGFLGIADGVATTRQFRTPPLWGLGQTAPYMHDGRADTIEEAIARHEAEGDASRQAYEMLSEAERGDLLAFLRSL